MTATHQEPRTRAAGSQALRPSTFKPGDALAVGLQGVFGRRGRALLTSIGIAIGIAAMVAVVGISASSKANVLSVLDNLGTNYLTITPGSAIGSTGQAELPPSSVERLDLIDQVEATGEVGKLDVTMRRSDVVPSTNTKGTVVLAASDDLLDTLRGELDQGHWLEAGTTELPTVVLGAGSADKHGVDLAKGEQMVWLGDRWFAVVGVLAPLPLAPELDNSALISTDVAVAEFGHDNSPTTVYVRVDPADMAVVQEIAAPTANPQNPAEVTVTRPADALEARAATDTAFTTLLLGLGGVALLVGGVGIANVMVISVLERRTEIGVRRALGATRGHVRLQFLVEALAQAGFGGVVGMLLGAAITIGYGLSMGWPIELPLIGLLGGVVAALAIGGLAGLYPANRAAKLQPAAAVRPQ